MTEYIRSGETSPYADGAALTMSAEEAAVWPLLAPWRADKRALFIDASAARYLLKEDAAGDPSGFALMDRAGGRIFEPHPLQGRHPYVVTDSVTGRRVLCFGSGGSGGNALSASLNGVLRAKSILDGSGAEGNAKPILLPDVGWSAAVKVRIPAPSATVNNRTFGSTPGGCILGGGTTTSNNGFLLSTRRSSGNILVLNANNVTPGLAVATDFRDSTWHDFVFVYNDSTGRINGWVDGVSVPQSEVVSDITTQAGGSDLLIGGTTVSTGTAVDEGFTGFLAAALFIPGPVLADSTARANVRALLATR